MIEAGIARGPPCRLFDDEVLRYRVDLGGRRGCGYRRRGYGSSIIRVGGRTEGCDRREGGLGQVNCGGGVENDDFAEEIFALGGHAAVFDAVFKDGIGGAAGTEDQNLRIGR